MIPVQGPVVYFGDSLTDNGNLYDFAEGLLPDALRDTLGGPTNAVSDGPTHAFYTAQLEGYDTLNYAVAAAEALGTQRLGDLIAQNGLDSFLLVPDTDPALDLDINLDAQVDRFIADTSGQDRSAMTAFVLIGGNDFGNLDLDNPLVIFSALALLGDLENAISDAGTRLVNEGVGHVVFSTLPPADFFPDSATFSDTELGLANFLVDSFNDRLDDAVSAVEQAGGSASIFQFDMPASAIVEDPTGFGIIAPYEQTLVDSNVLDTFDADQVVFYDAIHPSTATHGVIGAASGHVLSGGSMVELTSGSDAQTYGGASNLVFTMGGDDLVRFGSGADVGFGGTGRDRLFGQQGQDILSGGQARDKVVGNGGNDIIDGDGGNDVLRGGGGKDVIIDGLGSDNAAGQNGNDTFIYTEASLIGGVNGEDADVFDGGNGNDILYIVLSTESFATLATDLEGATPDSALASLGITATSIETIVAIEGRAGLQALSGESWFDAADAWGLI